MYAVITTGGKQYRVEEGDMLRFEKLEGDVGAPISFDNVLFGLPNINIGNLANPEEKYLPVLENGELQRGLIRNKGLFSEG